MSSYDSQRPLVNGSAGIPYGEDRDLKGLNKNLAQPRSELAKFHGDELLGDPRQGITGWRNSLEDWRRIFTRKNLPDIFAVIGKILAGESFVKAGAPLIGSMANDSERRAAFISNQVKLKYERMLHPPLTYLGDAFQYRTADGKFNSVLHPHLGQAGAPYAKTVPSKTHPLGALPDAGDLFDRLMVRDTDSGGKDLNGKAIHGRESSSGLSSMLIYHATIIIHDIFRTNDGDKNISDSSSYLDLSPLYGYTDEMVLKVRDPKYRLGLLKPDTFAEDRLLRQPPGVCIMLVMYNRYHNYAATQLRRINENNRFSVPSIYQGAPLVAAARYFVKTKSEELDAKVEAYTAAWNEYLMSDDQVFQSTTEEALQKLIASKHLEANRTKSRETYAIEFAGFMQAQEAAWKKLDDDLFNTARLITCGLYIQISIHDYLRALMGFHQFDTDFTLDPRVENKNVSRGLGNQVTVEFNLLYRFHCAISLKDEQYSVDFIKEMAREAGVNGGKDIDPNTMRLEDFLGMMGAVRKAAAEVPQTQPWEAVFGIRGDPERFFDRDPITKLFDDKKMIKQLIAAMDDSISNFGPKNIPPCLRSVEILGILQARKWEIGTLNDFREFFGMSRHETFESISGDPDIQNALRDLYEHPDKVELYPGVFCESDKRMNADPGPSDLDSALWAAIFSDAITLVRSDRFYTVDWNTNSLTSWGMKEVTQDPNVLKSSVFHRLLQRAFPEWFPYNSIRFFHPFYTGQKNAEYAYDQNKENDFLIRKLDDHSKLKEGYKYKFDISASDPKKPEKPLYLSNYQDIAALLSDTSDSIVHPSRLELANLPAKVADILKPGQKPRPVPSLPEIKTPDYALASYFRELMREIVLRESITMDHQKPTYQIDITRDFAIPITTRYVADFLGFGHRVRTDRNPSAPYSENFIYQHITNCQTFLSYNADETKLPKRREAFRSSMKFLYELTASSHIREASQWTIVQWMRRFASRKPNAMAKLGFEVAQNVLAHERDTGHAAAILLLIALDNAYNSVLAFSSVLAHFMSGLYDAAYGKTNSCEWFDVQQLAFKQDPKSSKDLKEKILDAQRKSVQLPLIRKALKKVDIKVKGRSALKIKENTTIICDIHAASQENKSPFSEADYLTYRSSFTQRFAEYNPKHVAVLALTSMIRTVAQMKRLRRGHDTQGRLKRVNLDAAYESYSNYMAPKRVERIHRDVQMCLQSSDPDERKKAKGVFKDDPNKPLKPRTDTYLTPEWDEMVPFPTTWKLRFDGFGESDYNTDKKALAELRPPRLGDFYPPFYQPQGPSHIGGSFADTVCICNQPGMACQCKKGPAGAATGKSESSAGSSKAEKTPADLVTNKPHGCALG